jgi:hypothetical protein
MAAPNIITSSDPGTAVPGQFMAFSLTLSPTAVANAVAPEYTCTVTGLLSSDIIIAVNKPTHQAGLGMVGARCTASGVLSIGWVNPTGATVTPTASEVYKVMVFRPHPANAVALPTTLAATSPLPSTGF